MALRGTKRKDGPRADNFTPSEDAALREAVEKFKEDHPTGNIEWKEIKKLLDTPKDSTALCQRWLNLKKRAKRCKSNPQSKSPDSKEQIMKKYVYLLQAGSPKAFLSSRDWAKKLMYKVGYPGTIDSFICFIINSIPVVFPNLSLKWRKALNNYIGDVDNWILDINHTSYAVAPLPGSSDEVMEVSDGDCVEATRDQVIDGNDDLTQTSADPVQRSQQACGPEEIEVLINEDESDNENFPNVLDDSGMADEDPEDISPVSRKITYTTALYGTAVSEFNERHAMTPVSKNDWQKCLRYVAKCENQTLLLSEKGWETIRNKVGIKKRMSDALLMQSFFARALPNRKGLMDSSTPNDLVLYAIKLRIGEPNQQTDVFLFHSLFKENEITTGPISAAINDGILSSCKYDETQWLKKHLRELKERAKQNDYDYYGATKTELNKMMDKLVSFALK